MKILSYSDVHVYPHSEYSKSTKDGLTTYLHEIRDSLYWVADRIIDISPDVVFNNGDWTHTYGYVDTMSLKVGQQGYNRIKQSCTELGIPHHAVVGNHDMYSDMMAIHSLGFMGSDVVDEIKVIETGALVNKERIRVLCIPYTDDLDRVRAALVKKDYDLIHSHLQIIGAVRYQGNLEEHGLRPEEFLAQTFNGHYHFPSDIGNVHIIGSLTTRTYHDLVPPLGRGIGIYDTETGRFIREDNPHAHKFYKVKVTEEGAVNSLRAFASKKTNCRVYYRPSIRSKLEAIRDEGIFSNLDLIPLPEDLQAPVRKPGVSIDLSPEENLRAWLRTTSTDLSKARLFKDGLEIISQARNTLGRVSARHAIQFLRARAVNLGPYEDQEIPLQGQGLVLIEGENHVDDTPSNGSGKTTVPDILYWTLTGQSLRGSEYKGNKIIREIDAQHNPHPDGGFGSVDFLIGESSFTVTRYQQYKGVGNALHLFQDGEDISARLKKGVQEHITNNLGIAGRSLLQTTILAASLSNRFTLLGDGDRKTLLEDIGGSSIYGAMKDIASQRATQARASLDNVKQQLEQVRKQLAVYDQESSSSEARRVKLEEEAKTLEARLTTQILQAQSSISNRLAEVQLLQTEELSLVERRTIQFGKLPQIDAKTAELTKRQIELSGTFSISKDLKQKLEKLHTQGHCDFCGQSVEVADVSKKLEEALSQCSTTAQVLSAVNQAYETLTVRKQHLLQEVQGFEARQRDIRRAISTKEQEISRLNQQIAQLKTSMLPSSGAIDQIIQERQRYLELAAGEKTKIELLEGALPGLEESLRYAEFWYVPSNRTGGFSPQGLPSFVLDAIVQAINTELEEISPMFLRDQKIRLTSTIQLGSGESRNKIGVEIIGGRHFSKRSSGERRKVDLAIQYALNEVARQAGAATNVLFNDEVDEHLDEGGLQAYVAVLGKKSQYLSVFCTTQNTVLKSFISKRWICKKEGEYPGISRISFG